MNQDQARRMAEEVELPEPAESYEVSIDHYEFHFEDAWPESQVREAIAAALVKLTQGQEPICIVGHYYHGRCVVEVIDQAALLPVGMPLYTHPIPSQQEERVQELEKALRLAKEALDTCSVGIYGDPLSFNQGKVDAALEAIDAARNNIKEQK